MPPKRLAEDRLALDALGLALNVRGRPLGRDREDQLDIADIGGEADVPIHGASIAGPGCLPRQSAAGLPAGSSGLCGDCLIDHFCEQRL